MESIDALDELLYHVHHCAIQAKQLRLGAPGNHAQRHSGA
jgi:hypothetical protein